MKTEKVPLAVIYKQNGFINVDFTEDCNKHFELFGFLKCLVNKMEEDMTLSIGDKNDRI